MHKVETRIALGIIGLAAGTLALGVAPASAQDSTFWQAQLNPLNGSEASGIAMVQVTGDQATVTIQIAGASASLPHAQHIHIGGRGQCPTGAADSDGDGYVSVPEGQPDYGAIAVSLTTSGDVSPTSGLDVDRMPTASAIGQISYSRTFTLPAGVTGADVASGEIVSHGLADTSLGKDPAAYDGGDSTLKAGVPLEATLPVVCGRFTAMPAGGMQTGGGGLAGGGSTGSGVVPWALAGVAGVVVVSGGALAARRRLAPERA